MDGKDFDQVVKRLGAGASRRRVLAGLGLATAATLIGGTATAKPSTLVQCKKDCNTAAKADRQACKARHVPGTNAKNACLKDANVERKSCRAGCTAE